jgi:hypothetical protein
MNGRHKLSVAKKIPNVQVYIRNDLIPFLLKEFSEYFYEPTLIQCFFIDVLAKITEQALE